MGVYRLVWEFRIGHFILLGVSVLLLAALDRLPLIPVLSVEVQPFFPAGRGLFSSSSPRLFRM